MSVERGPDLEGLSALLADLLDQHLGRDPGRAERLHEDVVSLEAADAGVAATIRTHPGSVGVEQGVSPDAAVVISTDPARLFGLAVVPLLGGLPDPRTSAGRRVLRDVLAGRIRIRGAWRHPRALARITRLLSTDGG